MSSVFAQENPRLLSVGDLSHLLFVNALTFALIDGLACIGGKSNDLRQVAVQRLADFIKVFKADSFGNVVE